MKWKKKQLAQSIVIQILGFGLWLCVGAHAEAQQAQEHEQPASVTLETITVTAEKLTEYIRNHPQQVTIVDRKEILERNFLNVEETLNSMPGIEVKPSAGIGSRISIRGSGKAGGVLVLLNGRPLNSSQYGGVDLSTIPIDIVKSVTVFKPPVPVWLGPGASEGASSSEAEARESEKLDDYVTVDLKLLQPFSWGNTRWEGYINLYNLFDQNFENHYGYPDDGFRLIAGINLTF